MKTWSQFKAQLPIVESVIPMNRQYGFLGTAGDKAHELLSAAVAHVKKASASNKHFQMSDKTIGHYLDSKGGRHLADLMADKAPPELIQKALATSIGEFSKTYNPQLFESYSEVADEETIDMFALDEAKIVNHPRIYAHVHSDPKKKSNKYIVHAPDHAGLKLPFRNKDAAKNWTKKAGYKQYHDGDTSDAPLKRLHEAADQHVTPVYAKANSTAGRFAAAKRLEAQKKARAEYLAKKNGTPLPSAEPEKKEAPKATSTHTPTSGIYHANPAKRAEAHRALHKILAKPVKASEASEKIKPHFDDEKLHSDIHHFAKSAPDIDVRPMVKKRMEQLRKHRGF